MPKNTGSSSSSKRPAEGALDRRRRKSTGVSSTNQLATAEAVGSDIMLQFYEAMQGCPQRIIQFYEESSTLGHADPHGTMDITTTLKIKMSKNTGSSSSSQHHGEGELDRRRRKSSGVSSTNQLATAQAVGSDIILQFYEAMQGCPQRTLQFYEESSKLARPDRHGIMDIVTTLKAIKEKILAKDFRKYSIDIRMVDEQESLNGGVTVLVTGSLTGKDTVKDFTQSFFLAPRGPGYFVLNDIFRYVDTTGHQAGNVGLVDERNKWLKLKMVPTGGFSVGFHQFAVSMPSAKAVGNAFVCQFYSILCQSPQLLDRFYKERSKLGRPEAHGVMGSVTTLKAIKEKIGAMSFKKPTTVIKTVDAQESFHGGVTVLVTGALTVADKSSAKCFIQSFFLAPQKNGYFVLNDIFRYVDYDGISCSILPTRVGTTTHSSPSIPEDAQLAMAISASMQSAIAEGVPMEHKTGDAREGDGRNLGSCVICLDAPVEGACIPCGHMAGCMSCLNAISGKDWGCPVCRTKVDRVLRLYAV